VALRHQITKGLIKRLRKVVGRPWLLTAPADLIPYSRDASGFSAMPEAVALPESAEQVCELLAICSSEGIPVYPRGAGSGTVGGAVAEKGGLIISMVRMNRMENFSHVDLLCRVGPGAVTGAIQKEAERLGLFYPPDPASLAFCTIGGNVATCAGGARAVKYGVTRDYVRALEVALADGCLVRLGSEAAKSVAGLDLARAVVGSEGLLGVITGITLRLLPLPQEVRTLVALFGSAQMALEGVSRLFQAGLVPRCAEFMDRMSLSAILEGLPFKVGHDAESLLIVEVDGSRAAAAEDAALASKVLAEAGALDVRQMSGPRDRQQLWQARRGLSPAIKRLGYSRKVSEDVCIPRSAMVAMLEFLQGISRPEAAILTFGHAGDGNLHVNLLLTQENAGDEALIHDIVEKIMEKSVELGGTISGEHGIGMAKRDYLPLEHSSRVLALERSVKEAFDPKGIMNPAKMFRQ